MIAIRMLSIRKVHWGSIAKIECVLSKPISIFNGCFNVF